MIELTFLNPWHKIGPSPLLMAKHVSLGAKSLNRVKKSWRWEQPDKASYEVIEPVQISLIVILNLCLKMFHAKQPNPAK